VQWHKNHASQRKRAVFYVLSSIFPSIWFSFYEPPKGGGGEEKLTFDLNNSSFFFLSPLLQNNSSFFFLSPLLHPLVEQIAKGTCNTVGDKCRHFKNWLPCVMDDSLSVFAKWWKQNIENHGIENTSWWLFFTGSRLATAVVSLCSGQAHWVCEKMAKTDSDLFVRPLSENILLECNHNHRPPARDRIVWLSFDRSIVKKPSKINRSLTAWLSIEEQEHSTRRVDPSLYKACPVLQ